MIWLVCDWFADGLWVVLVIYGRLGWFAGGLAGLWVVLSFKANNN